MSKTLEQALDEIVADIKAKQKKNARHLAKIHKLKRENRMLSDRRRSKISEVFLKSQSNGWFVAISILTLEIADLSECIGKNSAKIMRLRTMIKQSKV